MNRLMKLGGKLLILVGIALLVLISIVGLIVDTVKHAKGVIAIIAVCIGFLLLAILLVVDTILKRIQARRGENGEELGDELEDEPAASPLSFVSRFRRNSEPDDVADDAVIEPSAGRDGFNSRGYLGFPNEPGEDDIDEFAGFETDIPENVEQLTPARRLTFASRRKSRAEKDAEKRSRYNEEPQDQFGFDDYSFNPESRDNAGGMFDDMAQSDRLYGQPEAQQNIVPQPVFEQDIPVQPVAEQTETGRQDPASLFSRRPKREAVAFEPAAVPEPVPAPIPEPVPVPAPVMPDPMIAAVSEPVYTVPSAPEPAAVPETPVVPTSPAPAAPVEDMTAAALAAQAAAAQQQYMDYMNRQNAQPAPEFTQPTPVPVTAPVPAVTKEEEVFTPVNLQQIPSQSIESFYEGMDEDMLTYRDCVEVWASDARPAMQRLMKYVDSIEDKRTQTMFGHECEYINAMLDRISYFTELQYIDESLDLKKYSFSPMVKECMRRFSPFLMEKRIGLLWKNLDLEVVTDKRWFIFALTQIVFNAVEFTGENGKIAISAKQNGDYVDLMIDDNGCGISADDMPYIFVAGYMSDTAPNESGRRTGMGLFIARSVLNKLGGEVFAESNPGKGTRITMRMPVTVKAK